MRHPGRTTIGVGMAVYLLAAAVVLAGWEALAYIVGAAVVLPVCLLAMIGGFGGREFPPPPPANRDDT